MRSPGSPGQLGRRADPFDDQHRASLPQHDPIAQADRDGFDNGLVVDERAVGAPHVADHEAARGADGQLGVDARHDRIGRADGLDFALAPPTQANADAPRLVATACQSRKQCHAVGTRFRRGVALRRRRPEPRPPGNGGLEDIGHGGDRKSRPALPEADHVPGLEPRITLEAMSVQEGAVAAPEILELPAGRPVTQLGVQRRHHLDVRPRQDDGAIGAPAQPGDVSANLGRAAGPELDQLEVRHRAIVERRPARVNAAGRAPSAQPRGLRAPAPVGEHATLGPRPAHRAAALHSGAPVGGGAALDVHDHAGPPAFRSEAAVDTGPAVVELAAVGVGAAVGERFVAHGVAARVGIRPNVPAPDRVG